MLSEAIWLKMSSGLEVEITQAKEEGRDISPEIKKKVDEILKMGNSEEKELLAEQIYNEIQNLPFTDEAPNEPDDIYDIQSASYGTFPINFRHDEYYDKVLGAWQGRCAGCLLGKPVEGFKRGQLETLLKDTNNFPLSNYISYNIGEQLIEKHNITKNRGWIDEVDGMPEDDDTNYTVLGLKMLEKYGWEFTPEDVAESWLDNLPIFHLCTAERIAYRNLVKGLLPPKSATTANAYREWIGAQIRADIFGYVNPGNVGMAAEMAWRDASISHVKNGIYGEMFIAAMIAAAFGENNIEDIIKLALNELPNESRLTKAIETILIMYGKNTTVEDTIEFIHKIYDENNSHHWCHTISNAMIVVAALLYGENDFEKSITLAVSAGFDTDCNGATVGSVIGVILGAESLPKKWIAPLNDTLHTGVSGYNEVKITDIAKMTYDLEKRFENE